MDDASADALFGLLGDEPDDDLSRLLVELRWLALKHPIAAAAATRALREEGRRFAETSDGVVWKERLSRSELVRRGQLIWDVGTLGALDHDDRERLLPSALVDAFARAAARADLEIAIARRTEPPEDLA
ncbi:MAG TPA: hypothetical protein VHZ95_04055 [Polyangiales bacterium]|jgi:glycine/D-amino acid oxidase-like deaminating enzyme|nr:hypothetical protein [Polyangiales bacterium]